MIHNHELCDGCRGRLHNRWTRCQRNLLYATLVTRQQCDRYAKHQKSRSRDALAAPPVQRVSVAGYVRRRQCPFKCDAFGPVATGRSRGAAFFFHGGICAARKSREETAGKSGCGRAVAESTTVPAWLAVPAAAAWGDPTRLVWCSSWKLRLFGLWSASSGRMWKKPPWLGHVSSVVFSALHEKLSY